MTYCAGLSLRDGLVMLADTRTNAGIDDVAHYRKLHVFEYPGRGSVALAAAGNLSITQTALSLLAEGILSNDGEFHTLETANSMFHAAQLVGIALKTASERIGHMLSQTNISAHSSFLFGGCLHGGPIRLYLIYGLGNFIETRCDLPDPIPQLLVLEADKARIDVAAHADAMRHGVPARRPFCSARCR